FHDLGPHVAAGGVDLRTDHRVGRLAVIDQLLGDTHRLVRRDGEAQADGAGGPPSTQGGDDGGDAHELALEVHERTAGVSRVDGGVGLDGVDEGALAAVLAGCLDGTVLGGN